MLRRVVVCGTFHKDSYGLQRLIRELETSNCRILSPISAEFIDVQEPIVRTEFETTFTIYELEKFHLRAMREADLIWLHAPKGHVGISASYELGFAAALGKPVYCLQTLQDEMLASQVTTVRCVFDALDELRWSRASEAHPGSMKCVGGRRRRTRTGRP